MTTLGDALDAAIAGQDQRMLNRPQAGDLERIASFYGASPRTQNPRIAAVLAGTTDTRAKEYKAAIRSLQRYRAPAGKQRRTPGKATLGKLVAVARIGKALAYRKGARATILGTVQVSDDARRRTLGPVRLSGDALKPALDRWQLGNTDAAADSFLGAFRKAYGVRFSLAEDEDLEVELAP